jgi:hypothetical protein
MRMLTEFIWLRIDPWRALVKTIMNIRTKRHATLSAERRSAFQVDVCSRELAHVCSSRQCLRQCVAPKRLSLSLQHRYLNPVNKISSDARLTNSPLHTVQLQRCFIIPYLDRIDCLVHVCIQRMRRQKAPNWRDLKRQSLLKIIWHVDPLLGNDSEISNHTTAVTRQRSVNSNRGKVFSVRSAPICYKQGQLAVGVNE